MAEYVYPDVLVSTDWVKANLKTPGIRLVEIDVDTKQYEIGHIPGSVAFNWQTQLQDQTVRDLLSQAAFEALMSSAGIRREDTIIVFGDNNNWFAAYGFWLMKYYGHADVRIMNGGRGKWLNEEDKPLTTDKTIVSPVHYAASAPDLSLRAKLPLVLEVSATRSSNLVDVRSPDEFTGKLIAPQGMNETAQRGGHIPSASSIPWSRTVNIDGTFKTADELHKLYFIDAGLREAAPTICYCRIGERSSHSWFVLKYLLGQNDCKNYDGSWTEYGNLVGAPIERSAQP